MLSCYTTIYTQVLHAVVVCCTDPAMDMLTEHMYAQTSEINKNEIIIHNSPY